MRPTFKRGRHAKIFGWTKAGVNGDLSAKEQKYLHTFPVRWGRGLAERGVPVQLGRRQPASRRGNP